MSIIMIIWIIMNENDEKWILKWKIMKNEWVKNNEENEEK